MKKILLSSVALATLTTASMASSEVQALKNQMATMSMKLDKLEKKRDITVVKNDSEDFMFGKETDINMKIKAQDDPNMWLKAGVRIQGTFEKSDDVYDAYLRRVRFEISAGFNQWTSFVMDIRNDKANYENKGEESFNVGDAYLNIKEPFNSSLLNVKLYRAKIDVSRTETVKSAHVIAYDRPYVADEAAQFITHNRRGTNAQIYGDWNKKVHYQLAVGDGVYSGKLKDAKGKSFIGSDFEQKSFFYGGKVIVSPFDGWEEKSRTETYFGKGKHFEMGIAYWKSSSINYADTVSGLQEIDHTLINAEISAHYKGLFLQAEYFDFDGVVEDFSVANVTGKSTGWYATGEYVFPEFSYVAPYFRYEKWDKFEDKSGYELSSTVVGVNWYLRGNTNKVGLSYQEDDYGVNIGNRKDNSLKITTQWFF
jgi:hypothetical protein